MYTLTGLSILQSDKIYVIKCAIIITHGTSVLLITNIIHLNYMILKINCQLHINLFELVSNCANRDANTPKVFKK